MTETKTKETSATESKAKKVVSKSSKDEAWWTRYAQMIQFIQNTVSNVENDLKRASISAYDNFQGSIQKNQKLY
jgi:hypothetical protein